MDNGSGEFDWVAKLLPDPSVRDQVLSSWVVAKFGGDGVLLLGNLDRAFEQFPVLAAQEKPSPAPEEKIGEPVHFFQ